MSTLASESINTASPNKRKLIWFGFTIFFSSAILLVLEIVAGRLIAPYVGVSIYSWTSIIGVILTGLSLGNWIGGRWADRSGNETNVGVVLLLAAIFSIASLMFLTMVAPLLQNSKLDLISSSFIYVATMFFIPAALLGIVTPLLTTLALKLDTRAGHIVGRMHALAALGSIFGTFITGYWLVQYFGTRNIVIASAISLCLLAIPYLRKISMKQAFAMIALLCGTLIMTHTKNGLANPCQWESNYFCLRVVDASHPDYGSAKALILDHLMHGINHEHEADLLVSPYVHAMDEVVRAFFNVDETSELRYFFAGGGAYTQPRAVKTMYPHAKVTVAELDPMVTSAAQQAMFVDTNDMEIIHRDARTVLHQSQQKFDVVVTDVFHDISVPYHMVTREFAQTVKNRLSDNGLYLINIVDIFPNAKLVKSLVKTLEQEFQYVDVWLDNAPDKVTRTTYVISANKNRSLPQTIFAQRGFQRRWLKINEPLAQTGTSVAELPVLTDDYVPVELLLSELLFSNKAL
ncbi:fused MFS/spermidine synthase [Kaarinaea lacus]